MNSEQGSKDASTSPKEKEKLKQRLQLLFKQQEQRANQNKPRARSFQKKETYNNERSHVNGEPEKKLNNKAAKNKHNYKINDLLNGVKEKKILNEEPPTLQRKSCNGSLEKSNITELKKSTKYVKPHILPAAASSQQDTQQGHQKKKKSKQADAIPMHEEPTSDIPSSTIPSMVSGQKKKTKGQKKIIEGKKAKLLPQANKNKSKRAKNQKNGIEKRNLTSQSESINDEFDVSHMSDYVQDGDFNNEDNGYWNANFSHKKNKARKQTAAAEPVSDPIVERKKAKLLQQPNKNKSKRAKKQKNGMEQRNLTRQGESINDEFDVSHMSGFVQGGDFNDEYNEDNGYWNGNFSYEKKKAGKRTATAEAVSDPIVESKKAKLLQQPNKNKSKRAKKQKNGIEKRNLTSQSESINDEFDVSHMSDYVQGGDFNNEYNGYWNSNFSHKKKKARKQTAAAEPVSDPILESKKAKLLPQPIKNKFKRAKKQRNGIEKRNLISQSESINDEFDFSHMSGFVQGGDFKDEYNEDNGYWNANSSHDMPHNSELDASENGDDPYNYSDLDEDELGDDPYNYSDLIEDEGEEEEYYSDFDEDNYEEDEDSYTYSSDSQLSSHYDQSEDDKDYKLPEHVPEDLIIHSGTALKRDLLPEDNVVFKEKKYMQIVELKNQETVKVIRQPKEYQREELLKLTYKENQGIQIGSGPRQVKMKTFCAEENDLCPDLVPIVDGNGFKLYNPDKDPNENSFDMEDNEFISEEEDEIGSLGSEYTEICSDDADSLLSEDINVKYLYRYNETAESNMFDEENDSLVAQKRADVIDATKCVYSAGKIAQVDDDSVNTEKDLSQSLATLVQVDTRADIITTQVIDKKYLKHNNIEEIEESLQKVNSSNTRQVSIDDTKKLDEASNESTNDRISEDVPSCPSDCEIVEDITQQKKLSTNRPKNSAQSLADFSSIFCSATNANLVLVLLKDPFYIYGTVRLTLLAGTVEVYGHSLIKDVEVELFSPRGCSEIEISSKLSTAKDIVTKEKFKDSLKTYESNFLKMDLDKIVNSFDPTKDAIVLLKRNEERKKLVQQFKKFMNENVFPNLQNITMDRPLYDFEYLLRCMINITATKHKSLRLPEEWQNFSVENNSCVMIVGGKAVGKSTLIRFLINKHITHYERVLLIDLDIGQPELFVPQTVSCSTVNKPLLGPGFFLNLQPDKSFVVGNTNIALCPHKYVAAVSSLISYCHEQAHYRNIPWFINTMGYNKGFGLELISVIASQMPLTDVIQLQSNKAINNFDSLLYPQVVGRTPRNMFVEDMNTGQESSQELSYRLHTWRSAVVQESRYQKEWCMSPKDMRYANMLTRLSEALQGHAEWLSDCYPISAPLDELKLVNLMDEIPSCSPDELAKAMEANLVYLCRYQDDLSSVECLGIGVVRAVDFHVRQLYLIPALAAAPILKRCNSLALGETPLPSSLFTNQGSRVQKTAPFVYNTIEANTSKAIKQIYHRPTKFLKANKNTFD